ncbi:MAG: hypothetical protein E7311_07050 [Clostridiales bacterium]|nr:hypothetical protein [Clostridiales bacterium]
MFDILDNFDINLIKDKFQNISFSFLGFTLGFEEILIICILLFLFLEDNDDYILYLILILLLFS